MAHVAGKGGDVKIGSPSASTVTGIKSWSLDYTQEALETTDFADSGVRTYIIGPSGWSGSFEGYKDGAPQSMSSAVSLELHESASTSGAVWTGSAIITGVHATTAFSGAVSYTYDFQGTGSLSVPSA